MKRRCGDQPVTSEDVVETGDIFCYIWGYDQTNVDWYQVLSLTKSGKSASFQKVKSLKVPQKAMMCGTATPEMDSFTEGSQPFTKRIKKYRDELVVKMDQSSMVKWDGKPKSYSTWA